MAKTNTSKKKVKKPAKKAVPSKKKVVKGKKSLGSIKAPSGIRKDLHVLVKFNNEEFEVDTNDFAGSLLALKPTFIKTTVCITVSRDGYKQRDFILMPHFAKRIFNNELAAIGFASRIRTLFNAK
jgi:hypothetical protein